MQIQRFFCYFSWNPTAFTIGYRPTAIRLGWNPIPSKARVTRDDEQAHYNARYCLPDSHFLLVFNPETSSRVTLAALGIGFQPNLHQPPPATPQEAATVPTAFTVGYQPATKQPTTKQPTKPYKASSSILNTLSILSQSSSLSPKSGSNVTVLMYCFLTVLSKSALVEVFDL